MKSGLLDGRDDGEHNGFGFVGASNIFAVRPAIVFRTESFEYDNQFAVNVRQGVNARLFLQTFCGPNFNCFVVWACDIWEGEFPGYPEIQNDMISRDTKWHKIFHIQNDMISWNTEWHDIIGYRMTWYHGIQNDTEWHNMVEYRMAYHESQNDMISWNTEWHDIMEYKMRW